jgi:hypothetical protein
MQQEKLHYTIEIRYLTLLRLTIDILSQHPATKKKIEEQQRKDSEEYGDESDDYFHEENLDDLNLENVEPNKARTPISRSSSCRG